MRRSLVLALSIFSLVLVSCGGGAGTPAVQSALPPIALAPVNGSETPLAAAAFGDAIGVNLHLSYAGSPYDTDFEKWSPILMQSGIKHIRDAICPQSRVAWCQSIESPRLNTLATAGIRTDLLTALDEPFSYVGSYGAAMNVSAATEAFEGPNECDVSLDCPRNWQSLEPAWQQQLFALAAPGVTILGPSMVTAQGYAALGDLSAFMNAGNIHDYIAAGPPEAAIGAATHLLWAAATSGSKPVWSTEVNYSTDPSYADNGVPQIVQERYLPRLLLEHLRLGVMRTYIYQLFDFGPDGGKYMGLLNADYTPKPAWTRIGQLLRFFEDTGPSPRRPLTYTMRGDASGTLDHLLFQRSDGTYVLALWLAKPIYDPASHAVLSAAGESIALSLPATVSSASLVRFLDNGDVQTTPLEGSAGAFSVPVSPLVSVLEFRV